MLAEYLRDNKIYLHEVVQIYLEYHLQYIEFRSVLRTNHK